MINITLQRPLPPHSLRGYFIVLLSQKDQNVGSCDSPHAPHRPRRGAVKYVHCIIFTKLALLDYIFCFLAVVLIRQLMSQATD